MKFTFILSLLITTTLCEEQTYDSTSFIFDLNSFVSKGLVYNPFLAEKKNQIYKADNEKTSLVHKAILTKFEITGAIGPAPEYVIKENQSGCWSEEYDFTTMKPLGGFEIKIIQPLSFNKLRAGLTATQNNINLSTYEFQKFQIQFSQKLQHIYYNHLYAKQMYAIMQEVKKNLNTSIEKIVYLLENDDPSVTQENLFELKTYMFKIEDGLLKATNGLQTTKQTISFIFGTSSFTIEEKELTQRNDLIPNLDKLQKLLLHNNWDLKKLSAAIAGQKSLVKLAKMEMIPDIFAFGSYKKSSLLNNENDYKKSAELLNDPYNETVGSLGLGIKCNVNLWSIKDKYNKEKLELESLTQKESYASKALLLELDNLYGKVQMNRNRYISAENSLNASDSWLKSAAMKYDIDPSHVEGLLKAYQKNIQAKKDFYESILDYNISIADLISLIGLTLKEYNTITHSLQYSDSK